jgi:hypothetical protein
MRRFSSVRYTRLRSITGEDWPLAERYLETRTYGRAGFDLLRARVLRFHPSCVPAVAHTPARRSVTKTFYEEKARTLQAQQQEVEQKVTETRDSELLTTHDRPRSRPHDEQRLQQFPRSERDGTATTPHHSPQRSNLERRHVAHNAARTVRTTAMLEPAKYNKNKWEWWGCADFENWPLSRTQTYNPSVNG